MASNQQIVRRDPRVDRLNVLVSKSMPELEKAIPTSMKKHLTPDRITKIIISATLRQPKLLDCEPASILRAAMTATSLGLECDGVLGGAYLVPYGKEAQFIIGYRGLIELARRSGNIVSIEAHIVRRGDAFRCRLGTEGSIEHEPDWEAAELGKMFCVYAVAKFKDGGHQFEVMTRAQIDAIRRSSKAGNFGPWKTHYDEMARKTAVRRLAKYLPLSVDVRQQIAQEDVQSDHARVSTVGEVNAILGESIDAESVQAGPDLPGDDGRGAEGSLSAVLDPGDDDGAVVHDGFSNRRSLETGD